MNINLYICSRPVSDFSVVVSANANETEQYAAEELVKYIEKTTGDILPIVTDNADISPAEILVGRTNRREFTAALKPDGYEIAAEPGRLSLCGANNRGTLYAVYSYLEKYIGWRFFTSDCEILADNADRNIYAGEYFTDEPVIEYRDGFYYHTNDPALRTKMKMNAACTNGAPFPEKMGGCKQYSKYFVHSFPHMLPADKYFDEHPEYFALRDGKREPTQPCLTNPDVLKIITQEALNILRTTKRDFITISQHDNQGYCTCDKCRAIDEAEGSHCGSLLHFVNAVAEEIEKEFPDVLVDTLAYQYTRNLPKHVRPRKNVMIRLCSIECCFRHPLSDTTCEDNIAFAKDLTDWSKICDKLHVWDYVTDFSHYVMPLPNIMTLRDNMKFFADHNVKGMMTQGPYNGKSCDFPELKCYLIGKLLWNPYMSKEEYEYYIKDFLKGFYGKSWECIHGILQIMNDATSLEHFGCFANPNDHYIEFNSRMGEVECLIAKAIELADNDDVLTRVRKARLAMLYISINYDHDARQSQGGDVAAKLLADKQLYLSEFYALGVKRNEWRAYPDEIDIDKIPMKW